MNVSTWRRAIKLLLCALPLGGCAAAVADAPFTARPGSVVRGDLHGPFDGRVLDADTGKPIAGAEVLASWAYEGGAVASAPAVEHHTVVLTDSDGRYAIASAPDEGRTRLARATLVIYKRGYVAWRSDRRFEDFGPRTGFTQTGNVASLARFAQGQSHARQVRYLGGGGPLGPSIAWELQQAADEAQGGWSRPTASGGGSGTVLDVSALLSADELKAVTGFDGSFELGKLGDAPSSAEYDSIHFRAVGRPESWDAALRVYAAGSPEAADAVLDQLGREYPSVEARNEVGDRSLRAHENDILAVVTEERKRGLVLVFTCGVEQCHDADTVAGIVKRVMPRLDRVRRVPAPPPPANSPAPADSSTSAPPAAPSPSPAGGTP